VRANALEYTDVYYNPAESGWGVFLVQSDVTQFVALFIYGTDNKPTWYTATLKQDAAGNYNGQLIATTGSYFGSNWNSSQLTVNPVGTISFQPTDSYRATVTYALNGGPTVTKSVQRQTLTAYQLPGNYSGSMSGTRSSCTNPSDNEPKVRGRFNLVASQTGDAAAALTFTFVDPENNGVVCTVQGPLTHFGRLYKMVGAQLSCTEPGGPGPETTTVVIDGLHPTGQGIEFRVSGPTGGGGCIGSLRFSAVLNN
jgi:hypothetical protein